MRTRPFRTVLEAAFAEAGTPYLSATTAQLEVAANAVSFRVQTAADMFPWPELIRVEERAFCENWFVTKTYAADDVVWSTTERKYYIALQASTNVAVTNTSYWAETTTPTPKIVELEQYGATKIARLWDAWKNDPRSSTSNRSWNYTFHNDRFDFPDATGNTVWLVFSPPPPKFTTVLYDAGADYDRYDQVYSPGTENGENFPDRGENYMLELDTSNNPFWQLVPFPAALYGYCVYGCAATMLRNNGNREVAMELEAIADQKLQTEWDKARPLIRALVKGVAL